MAFGHMNVLVEEEQGAAQGQDERGMGGGNQSGEAWEAHVDCSCWQTPSAAAGHHNTAVPFYELVLFSWFPGGPHVPSALALQPQSLEIVY